MPNTQNFQTFIYDNENYWSDSNQMLHNDNDSKVLLMGGPQMHFTYSRWSTAAILKSKKLRYLQSRWSLLMTICVMTHIAHPDLNDSSKTHILKNPECRTPAILKTVNTISMQLFD